MSPKIIVILSDTRLSVRYAKKNNYDNRGDSLRKLQLQWSSLALNLLVELVQDRAAVVYVYTSDGDFTFPEIDAKIWTETHHGITYFLAASNNWKKSDIEEITALMQFELSTLWIELVSDIDQSKVDPVVFMQSVDRIVMGEEDGNATFQCIGNTRDGEEIIWEHPNWNEAEHVLEQLKIISSVNGFQCEISDERNKT